MKIWKDFAKPIVVLGVICLAASFLLAVTNGVTAPIIEENALRTANETRQALLPAAGTEGFVAETVPGSAAGGVTEIYRAVNGAGYVITASAGGYGGEVPVMVAFGEDGAIVAARFLENSETPGLGQRVRTDAFQTQFAGMAAEPFALEDIDALTGATISSRAATNGINAAIDAYNELQKGA